MEQALRPARVPSPGRVLRRELEARGWTQKDLAEITGRPEKTISQIMNGRKQITPETALELAAAFGTLAELWLNLETQYRLRLAEAEHSSADIERKSRLYSLLPISEMQKKGWLDEHDSVEELERQVLEFLGISTLDQLPSVTVHLRQPLGHAPEVGARMAWLKRVEHLAAAQRAADYSLERLENAVPDLVGLSTTPERAAEVQSFLVSLGVHFCIVPDLKHTCLDGAALDLDGHPIVALTLRHSRIDSFWFTLFHELAHIIARHEGSYLDNLEEQTNAPEEDEANRMAENWLLNSEHFTRFVVETSPHFTREKVVAFAEQQGRHPGIVVGRLHHEGLIPHQALKALQVDIRSDLEPWIDVAKAV